jgi:hypothetical protein
LSERIAWVVERTPMLELRAAVSGEVLLERLTHNVGLPLTHRRRQVLQLVLLSDVWSICMIDLPKDRL